MNEQDPKLSFNLKDLRTRRNSTDEEISRKEVVHEKPFSENHFDTPLKKKEILEIKIENHELDHHKNKKLLGLLGLLIIIGVISGIVFFSVFQTGEFYKGTWEAQTTLEDKKAGVAKVTYKIEEDKIVQTIDSSSPEGIVSKVELLNKVELKLRDSNLIAFISGDLTVTSVDVQIPQSICTSANKTCDQMKIDFTKNLNEQISKQSKVLKGSEIRISKAGTDLLFINGDTQLLLSKG